ncbi:hypothetical protein GOB15_07050 [Sinorhizobium meliloti]|nr:hypothetical protein [Sinorhizobium meliloti]MDW9509469.1 hypothetical protein [Sinorhizobium meliloti]MDX0906716.1 hypothetical protein [Sinorhizobium medicae]
MTKDKKSKPTIHCPPDDPLGVDPDNLTPKLGGSLEMLSKAVTRKPSRWKLEPPIADGA